MDNIDKSDNLDKSIGNSIKLEDNNVKKSSKRNNKYLGNI